jgi:hypothetical protein
MKIADVLLKVPKRCALSFWELPLKFSLISMSNFSMVKIKQQFAAFAFSVSVIGLTGLCIAAQPAEASYAQPAGVKTTVEGSAGTASLECRESGNSYEFDIQLTSKIGAFQGFAGLLTVEGRPVPIPFVGSGDGQLTTVYETITVPMGELPGDGNRVSMSGGGRTLGGWFSIGSNGSQPYCDLGYR